MALQQFGHPGQIQRMFFSQLLGFILNYPLGITSKYFFEMEVKRIFGYQINYHNFSDFPSWLDSAQTFTYAFLIY